MLKAWRDFGSRGAGARADWNELYAAKPATLTSEFKRRVIDRELPKGMNDAILKLKRS